VCLPEALGYGRLQGVGAATFERLLPEVVLHPPR